MFENEKEKGRLALAEAEIVKLRKRQEELEYRIFGGDAEDEK